MSGRIVGEVLRHAPVDLTVAQRFVLVALAEDARDSDRVARECPVDVVAARTGLKPGTVHNAITELAQRGLIRRRVDKVAKGGKHQEYVLARLAAHHRFSTVNDLRERA